MTNTTEKKVNNYVDKKEFYDLLVKRKKLIEKCKTEGKQIPKLDDKIGKIILDIATNLAYRYNFINYSYRDEFIGDAIETCIRYVDNFDPEKSKNPFGYYTQICYFSFVRRINKEAKQHDIKKKYIEKMGLDFESYTSQLQDQDKAFKNTSVEFAQENLI